MILAIVALGVVGCTPNAYKRDADAQIEKILRERKQQALGYQPQAVAETDVDPVPARIAFEKIPTTPIPPPITSPMEPARRDVPFGPTGPLLDTPDPTVERDMELFGAETSGGGAAERARMGPPDPRRTLRRLDLFGALHYAVQHSRRYQSQMEELYLSALDVSLERHLFEPRPFINTSLIYDGGQADVNYRSALTAATSAGVRQKLPYGGEIVASTLVQFVNALNDTTESGESASVALRATIPLLRGAGMVNLEPLINSERQLIYDVRAFEDFRRQFLVETSSLYFRLLTSQQSLNNRRQNYNNLSLLTERTRALFAAGRISFLEVQRSQQALLVAENSLITAQATYQTQLDSFKVVLGMPVSEELEITAVVLDVQVPEISAATTVELAHRYRLDLQTARDQIEDARRGVSNARNDLLPDLNLTAQGQIGNREEFSAANINSRTSTYSGGISLDLPIDRLAERNTYRRSLIGLQRQQRTYEQLRDTIAINARDSLRTIRSAQVSLEIQRMSIDLAQRRLDFSNELLRQGKVTSRDVVEAQTSLLDAQDAYDRARAQLQISLLEYLRQTGTLRVDAEAGSLGRAMNRAEAGEMNKTPPAR